ncbi:hypothetical protein C8J56DRAFT_900104 [Mycena floridula]|nr:hypothetical protein C8J56DRAFT_900104 [Mycena floridula]
MESGFCETTARLPANAVHWTSSHVSIRWNATTITITSSFIVISRSAGLQWDIQRSPLEIRKYMRVLVNSSKVRRRTSDIYRRSVMLRDLRQTTTSSPDQAEALQRDAAEVVTTLHLLGKISIPGFAIATAVLTGIFLGIKDYRRVEALISKKARSAAHNVSLATQSLRFRLFYFRLRVPERYQSIPFELHQRSSVLKLVMWEQAVVEYLGAGVNHIYMGGIANKRSLKLKDD